MSHRSKTTEEFAGQTFDCVVTVCDNAREALPLFSGGEKDGASQFFRSVEFKGTDEEVTAGVRAIRDEIKAWITRTFGVNGGVKVRIPEAFKALGDPVRLEIVRRLVGRELCVCDILEAFKLSQPTVSHHLKVLKYAGLVTDRKDGKWVYYRLNGERIGQMMDVLGELNFGGPIEPRRCGEEE